METASETRVKTDVVISKQQYGFLVSTLMDRLSCSESGEPGGVEVCAGSLSRSTSITAEQLLLPVLSSPKKYFCMILKLLFLTCGSSTLCTISFVKRITGNVGLF